MTYIKALINYAINCGLIDEVDRIWATNRILEIVGLDTYEDPGYVEERPLHEVLDTLCDLALETGSLQEDSIVYRDIFDTKIMGALTATPREIRKTFKELYDESPVAATEWYYEFAQKTNYIRKDRISKDLKWVAPTIYGDLDITVNLSKPEKDPKAIAAAKSMPQSSFPKCLLCKENEGYAGRVNHPARQNHRIIPLTINRSDWFMQYSPYVYYNEHCIIFNSEHIPMKIEEATFRKLLDFVKQFPHYFLGSNADLPIVGGSILSHDHFQGGNYQFAMAKAPIEQVISFKGFENVKGGIVKWPMSVIRLRSQNDEELVNLASIILEKWRSYTDAEAFVFAETEGEPHNTITPIARMRDGEFELDLVLRNNITTEEHPLGLYHPHKELHHIKKENIGLIEVMGLAVLPARLKSEMQRLEEALLKDEDVENIEEIRNHGAWARELKAKYEFSSESVRDIIQKEIGIVFGKVLEHAGVYKCNEEGRIAFMRFIDSI